ncbi:MAG: phosphopentomutase [Candidatus Eremiobacteraeota bacterium]|nr:phosphopentomutase [Candidatus Eremiobacteraeota bacterium]
MPRHVTIVLDSGGVGALPDFATFGDAPGANTIGNVAARAGGLHLPFFEQLGLGALTTVPGLGTPAGTCAGYARLQERSVGKDTITGHWEMVGIITEVPFPTYPQGFPRELVAMFTQVTGKEPLWNKTASGTEIIARLGEEHQKTGRPILYTSADSVFQVAAHEETVPLETLYAWCETARERLVDPHNVNRVIARPFAGTPGHYMRTANRRDYAVEPPQNLLDRLSAARVPVHAVGKISDIYNGRGITTSVRIADNEEAMRCTLELMDRVDHGLIFTNLNDFDSKYGHRRDVAGYAQALERLDLRIEGVLERMRPGDRLVFTADHGCDPTAPGTDHTREFVPFIEVGNESRTGYLGTIQGLDAVAASIEDVLCAAVA